MTIANFLLIVLLYHPTIELFFHSTFLHRYVTHAQFIMNRFWQKVFYVCTFLTQGPSHLNPTAYAILHKNHHDHSDEDTDSHTPKNYKNIFAMMWDTRRKFVAIPKRKSPLSKKYLHTVEFKRWRAFEKFADNKYTLIGMGVLYILFYVIYAPTWGCWFCLPVTLFCGPIHGAIVNWWGHKKALGSYRNYDLDDNSQNVWAPVSFLMLNETYQNNHHAEPMNPNFGGRHWHEIDLAYFVLKIFDFVGIIQLPKKQSN